MKRFEGIWTSSPEKRYRHFVNHVADWGKVWMLSSEDGFTALTVDGYIHLLVWPSEEFAKAFDRTDYPVEIEVHEFCRRCNDIIEQENIRFMVFPTDKNSFVVETEELLNDILAELELIE